MAGLAAVAATFSERTLGDIIVGGSLLSTSLFSPEERIVLSANGNVQRLISSYYNATVSVQLLRNERRTGADSEYEREVELSVLGLPFATARSTVVLTTERLIDAVERHGVALGQLFRHFELLPTFELLAARRLADGGFERTYTLCGSGISCAIHETFPCGLFDLRERHATTAAAPPRPPPVGTAHFGDIMAAAQTGMELPAEGFSPLQRLLLTANGNVQRIVSAYYDAPVAVHVLASGRAQLGGYERQVVMALEGRQFMSARSSVHVLLPEWRANAEAGVPLGSLFQHMRVLPQFQLHSVGKGAPGYFWRAYSLRCDGMACEIHETFVEDVFELRARREGQCPDTPSAAQHFC
jgi:chorismate-pyruvate lyase